MPFDAMVTTDELPGARPGTWMPRVPVAVVSALAWCWRRTGHVGPGHGALARLSRDQMADLRGGASRLWLRARSVSRTVMACCDAARLAAMQHEMNSRFHTPGHWLLGVNALLIWG
jgi:hypothetical protein